MLSCLCRGVRGEKGSVLLSCICRARGMGVWEQYCCVVCISREEDNDKHARVEPAGSEYKAEELVNWEGSTRAFFWRPQEQSPSILYVLPFSPTEPFYCRTPIETSVPFPIPLPITPVLLVFLSSDPLLLPGFPCAQSFSSCLLFPTPALHSRIPVPNPRCSLLPTAYTLRHTSTHISTWKASLAQKRTENKKVLKNTERIPTSDWIRMAHRSWFQITGRGLGRFDNLKRLMALGFEPIIQKDIKDITKAALDALSKASSQEPPPEQLGVASDQCQKQLAGICWMQR